MAYLPLFIFRFPNSSGAVHPTFPSRPYRFPVSSRAVSPTFSYRPYRFTVLSRAVRPKFPPRPYRFPVSRFSVPTVSLPVSSCVACSALPPRLLRRALLAQLPLCLLSSLRAECIALSASLLFLSGTVGSTTFSVLWAVCFTDCLQCAVFVALCVEFFCVDLVCLVCAYNR